MVRFVFKLNGGFVEHANIKTYSTTTNQLDFLAHENIAKDRVITLSFA
jgi:hypothetical protein